VIALAAPATEGREASPIALVLILLLLVAVVLLVRSMTKHLRKVPPTFADRDERGRPVAPEAPADPADPASQP
jgi:hypothetical protein